MENNSQNKIEKTLSSLDNVQRATPQPYFYTRLMAKLSNAKQDSWERFGAFITRPAMTFTGISLIILINIVAAYSNLNNPVNAEQTELTATDEYTQVATNFYDLENMKPQ